MENKEKLDILTLQELPEEQQYDFIPKTFDDYLGQENLKKT